MFNRRTFLHRSLAGGLGLHGISSTSTGLLDHLCSRSQIPDRHRPISPDRVIVLNEKDCEPNQEPLRKSLTKRFDLSSKKIKTIVRLMQALSDHYHAPHLLPKWATTLAHREALGSTGCGHGFGLLHQFQDDGLVRLANPPVDWWLVLFPEGVEWQTMDDEPVFGMLGHVFSPDHQRLPGIKLRAYMWATVIGTGIGREKNDAWARIARMDRSTAAEVVNEFVRSKPDFDRH